MKKIFTSAETHAATVVILYHANEDYETEKIFLDIFLH